MAVTVFCTLPTLSFVNGCILSGRLIIHTTLDLQANEWHCKKNCMRVLDDFGRGKQDD